MFGGGDSSSEGDLMDFDLDAPKPSKPAATAKKDAEPAQPSGPTESDLHSFEC